MTSPIAILTRPQESCQDLAYDLKTIGFTPVLAPMTRIIPVQLSETLDVSGQTLIFTSANAVRIFAGLSSCRDNPVLAVGDQTAQVARTQGFTDVFSAGGTGEDLIRHILTHFDPGHDLPMTHLCGVHLATPIEESLSRKNFHIKTIELYSADLVEEFPASGHEAMTRGGPVHVLFFSARAAAHFEALTIQAGLDQILKRAQALSLSDRVAGALNPARWAGILSARSPDHAGMLDLARTAYRASCAGAVPPS